MILRHYTCKGKFFKILPNKKLAYMTFRQLKWLLVLLLLAGNQAYAQKTTTVNDALKKITKEFKTDFVYDPQVTKNKTTTYNLSNLSGKSLEDVLKEVLYPNGLVFLYVKPNYYTIVHKDRVGEYQDAKSKPVENIVEKTILSSSSSPLAAQEKIRITGVVTGRANQVLPNVTVTEKSTSTSTMTGEDGSYTINVTNTQSVLVFSSVGYNEQEELVGNRTKINVQLQTETQQLSEVVVTALGVRREEKALGYAVQSVTGTALQTVKGVDMATSLTGKVSGLVVKNSTEFNGKPTIEMRGENPLLVIDGVPYGNMTLRDIPTDDIQSIDMLKGSTAAALYGARGSAGAIMITTKRGKGRGLSVDVNSNTMLTLGYVAIPKTQTSYGHGINGQISDDYVWGPKLDIGTVAKQWNPLTKQMEDMPLVSSGKDNLKNFMNNGIITNNSIAVTQTGENGFFRASLNHIYNKGQFPNQNLNIYNYTMTGEMKINNKFSLESHMGYTRTTAPQTWGGGYNNQGYIYQILMWTGPEYDIRQYKDYWITPNEKQNWLYTAWYDNPYLIAYEKLVGLEENKLNASLTANYSFTKDLKLTFRNGYDYYKAEDQVRNPAGIYSTRGPVVATLNNSGYATWNFSGKGMYGMNERWGNSINSDLLLNYTKKVKQFNIDVLGGASIYYYQNRELGAKTENGLAVPGWYSLANAVASTAAGMDAIKNNYGKVARQINSLYGKASVSWRNAVFVDVTGRNDWSSTQPSNERSYFYPSVASSVVLSEFFNAPSWLSLWKVRGSWTITKTPLDVFASNTTYSTTNSWGYTDASLPDNLMGSNLSPSTNRTWEVGMAAYLFGKRLHVDVAYFSKLYYNQQIKQTIAPSSGYASTLINTDETFARRGVELTLSGTVIQTKKFEWNSMINYSYQHRYFVDIDPVYSKNDPWTKPGKRVDYYAQTEKILRDPQGNWIHQSDGRVALSNYQSLYGYRDPDFSFGFINNFNYNNWMLTLSIDGRIGGLFDNYIFGKMFDTGSAPETDTEDRYNEVVNKGKYIGKGVKVESGSVKYDAYGNILEDTRKYAVNDIPVSYQSYMRLFGNSWENRIMNKSFIKLREISIGYRIPDTWLGKSGLKNASVSLTGQNLLMWTKAVKYTDPDVDKEDMNSPSQRMVGLNIKFGL